MSSVVDLPEARLERAVPTDTLLGRGLDRQLHTLGFVLVVLCVLLSIFHIFTASIGSTESYQTRTFVVSLAMVIGYLLYPTGRTSWTDPLNKWFVLDALIILFIVVTQIHLFYEMERTGGFLISGMSPISTGQIVLGTIYVVLLMEMTRRCAGLPMLLIALFFLIYVLFAEYAPDAISAPNTRPAVLIRNLFFNVDGIFGVPVGAMTDYVIIFIFFGQMLATAGAGEFFTRLAMALTGRQVGGPAKASVLSSSMMGTISGSAVGNVVTTGSVTIPLMQRSGYRPHFAAAVESVSSTGGQIMPPVMGAVAFIMAQLMGVPYVEVAMAAIVPAGLYYWAAFWAVHWEAKRLKLPVLQRIDVPQLGPVMREGWQFLLPVFLLVGLLASGSSLVRAAFLSSMVAFAVSFLRRDTRITPRRLLGVLEATGRYSMVIIIVAAAAGVIVSVVTTSGLSWRSLALLVDFAENRLWLALLLAAIIALILGMGVSTTAVYVTLAAILVPALITMGLHPMAAHMFALYYAVIGLVTPPVAMAAFAAAGIANAPPMKVAVTAARIALPIYLVPFIFAYDTSLLLIGDWQDIAIHVVTAFAGVWLLSSALWGQMMIKLNYIERIVLFVSGVMLLLTTVLGAVVGIALAAAVITSQWWRRSRQLQYAAAERAEQVINR
jgi:TRAP transporter 4TM/12TM fusion protein